MPLCERPAGQSMENPTSPSHRELARRLREIQHQYEQGRIGIYFCEVLRYVKTAFLNRISKFFRLVCLTDCMARRARRIEKTLLYMWILYLYLS